MLYIADRPAAQTTEVREALMGFRIGDTRVPGLSQHQRVHLLGQCTDLNAIAWTVTSIQTHLTLTGQATPNEVVAKYLKEGYTSSQPFPTMTDTPLLPERVYTEFPAPRDSHPVPYP